MASRVTSLTEAKLATSNVIEVPGVATYYKDVGEFSAYGIVEPGWYVFCRIKAPAGTTVTLETSVEGAAG